MRLTFASLNKSHNRAAFRSGDAVLDNWFHKQAGQDERRNLARVFVALDNDVVAGFYSVGAFSLSLPDLPEAISAKLPHYPRVPSALIGRLARDQRYAGQGIGELLVADAIRRILAAAQESAVFAIVVDAKNDDACDFYRRLGFIPFPLHPLRLFMLISTAAAAFAAA